MKKSHDYMMPKIRVVQFCNVLDGDDPARAVEAFCNSLDRAKFEVFAVSRTSGESSGFLRSLFGSKPRAGEETPVAHAVRETLGADHLKLAANDRELRRLLLEIKPDILHVHYSGKSEAPTNDAAVLEAVPVTVTSNYSYEQNTSPAHERVKRIFFASHWLMEDKAEWAYDDPRSVALFPPIPGPASQEDLRKALGIPQDAFVIGAWGPLDPSVHDPIALRAYMKLEDARTYLLAFSPPPALLAQAKQLGLKNLVTAPSDTGATARSKFFNSIDVLAHARIDGEAFGYCVAEAMMHGKPVVSHRTDMLNGHVEIIGDAGFVVKKDDWKEYAEVLESLKRNPSVLKALSVQARKHAEENFDAALITGVLEENYLGLLNAARS